MNNDEVYKEKLEVCEETLYKKAGFICGSVVCMIL